MRPSLVETPTILAQAAYDNADYDWGVAVGNVDLSCPSFSTSNKMDVSLFGHSETAMNMGFLAGSHVIDTGFDTSFLQTNNLVSSWP